MTVTIAPFRIRPMTVADIPRVVAIERSAFPTSWHPDAYRRELEQNNLARYLVAVADVVAGREEERAGAHRPLLQPLAQWLRRLRAEPSEEPAPAEQIVGFLGLWFMVEEVHIVSVAVDEGLRRRGVGEMLIAEALDLARAHHAEHVTLEVRVSNTGAQALYDKYGFRRMGIRKRYYTDNGEDAMIMTTPPLTDAAYAAHLAELRERYIERYGLVRVEG